MASSDSSTILGSIWLQASNDFQQRVPEPTQRNIREVFDTILSDADNDAFTGQPNLYTEFCGLIGRIGMTLVNDNRWENPLAQFKRGRLNKGQTIQEIGTKLIKAKGYDLESSNIFNLERPDSEVAYYNIARKERYDLSFVEEDLRQAFIDNSLGQYIASIMGTAVTSDNWDEYQTMIQLFEEYRQKYGFVQEHVEDLSTATPAEMDKFIERTRALASRFKILSSKYNKAGIPTSTKPGDLRLFCTPEVVAHMDVAVLAKAFNVDLNRVPEMIVEIDGFHNPNTQAILADKNFFVVADYTYKTTQFFNPKNLGLNTYLHHWEVLGASPFVNAVEFTTEAVASPTPVVVDNTGLSVAVVDEFGATVNTASVSGNFSVVTNLTGTVTPATDGIANLPDSATFKVVDETGKEYSKNSRVFRILRNGQLFIADSAIGHTFTITATSTYVDPDAATPAAPLTATVDIAIA